MQTRRVPFGPLSGLVLLVLAAAGLAGSALVVRPAQAIEGVKTQASPEELVQLEAGLADARTLSRAFSLVAKIARPGVVHLRVRGGEMPPEADDESSENDSQQLRDMRRFLRRVPPGAGSGIIFTRDGYILTNNHVVEDRDDITVILHDEREFKATVVGTDPKTDIAVIKIEAADLQPLPMGDSDALEVGEFVIAVGSPFGLQQTVTHGIVSAKGRANVPGVDIDYQDFIQTDAAINPGNSGGPLLNLKGEVVGINTAIATRGDGYNAGVAFTIPSRLVTRIAEELKTSGTVRRGYIGIRYRQVVASEATLFGLRDARGVIIDRVQRRSPADRAGLEPEDVIIELNGQPVDGQERLRSMVADMKPDERVKLRVIRDGEERSIDMRLGLQPADMRSVDESAWIESRPIARLGIDVTTIEPPDLRIGGGDIQGVRVDRVAEDGPSGLALDPGDIITSCNGKTVTNVAELKAALRARGDAKVKLEVRSEPSAEARTVTISPAGSGEK